MPAYISEIFNSIQGEGPYVGVRQVFVRFKECQLNCIYCDTPRNNSAFCRIEEKPGSQRFEFRENPLEKDDMEKVVRKLWSPSTRHISLTGGEPLIHADFIETFDPGKPLYLETNSGLPEKARRIRDKIAIASCDIKLREHGSTERYDELLKKELETISIFNETSETFVKIIVLPETTEESLSPAIEGIAGIDKKIPLILQPVTAKRTVQPDLLLGLMDFAGKKLKNVRAIPQTHKILGLL